MSSDSPFGKLRRKMEGQRLEDGVPGCFSPRPSHSRSLSTVSSNVCDVGTTANVSVMLHNLVGAAEGSVQNTSVPLTPGAAPPPPQTKSVSPEGFSRSMENFTVSLTTNAFVGQECMLRRSHPMVTLMEHERARSFSTSLPHRHAAAARVVGEGNQEMVSFTQTEVTASEASCTRLTVCEAYVSAKPWRYASEDQRDAHRNALLAVSALATSSSGEHVAIGDRSGRLLVMLREHSEKRSDLEGLEGEEEREETSSNEEDKGTCRITETYKFTVGRQAYTSVIDPLNSVEVTPNIQALCFLPRVGLTTYLLTANEKMPKLYKVVHVRESPPSFSALKHLGEKVTSSLTLNPLHGRKTPAMKQVARYALNHEYKINSLCPLADSAQFLSADDLAVKLWCVEYPDTSIETYGLKSPFEEDIQETICGIQCFPHEPFLLFVLSTSGTIRVVDTRQTLKWIHQTPLVFRNTHYGDDILFNGLSDCALSPCGRYVAGRDVMSACLWDIRRPGVQNRDSHLRSTFSPSSPICQDEYNVVRRWELYPHLRQDIDQVLQGGVLERFRVRFLNNHEICTGGFYNGLYLVDTLKADSATDHQHNATPRSAGGGGGGGGVRQLLLQLPQQSDACDRPRDSLHSLEMDSMSSLFDDAGALLDTCVTQLSPPLTSSNGECCMLASCGHVVFQLTYPNLQR